MSGVAATESSEQFSCVVASFPKSGRTWLSFLYAYYVVYARAGADADGIVDRVGFDYLPDRHRLVRRLLAGQDVVPRVGFTHALPRARPYYVLKLKLDKLPAQTDALLLLVRDLRDVVVSFFHHVRSKGAAS